MKPNIKDVWKNEEMMTWLDASPLHAKRSSLEVLCSKITKAIVKNPKALILDVACGPGSNLRRLLQRGVPIDPKQYLGVDFSPKALELAKKHLPEYQFKLLDVIEETLPEAEIVLCMDVLQHLEHPMRLVKNLFQATKRICFINTWAIKKGDGWDEHHVVECHGKFNCMHRQFDIHKLEKGLREFDWKLSYAKITFADEWAGILEK